MLIEDTWIETTTYRETNRTLWLVRLAGTILKSGELRDDPSGLRAYELATIWAQENTPGVEFNWKQTGPHSNS